MFITTTIICIRYNDHISTSMVTTNSIICIWYNDLFRHPWLPPTGSFVFDTTFHIHGHHSHDHLYSIQWSSSTSSSITTMIIHIWYNDPLVIVMPHLLPALIPTVTQRGPDLKRTSVPMLGFGAVRPPQAQRLLKLGKFWPWQRLGEDVGYVIIHQCIFHLNFSIFDRLMDEMIS